MALACFTISAVSTGAPPTVINARDIFEPVTHSARPPSLVTLAPATDPLQGYEVAYGAENWDGYGALPIARETVAAARVFYEFLAPFLRRSVPNPDIAPGPDGTIGFEWDFASGEYTKLFVEIQPNQMIRWFRIRRDGNQFEKQAPEPLRRGMYRLDPMLDRVAQGDD